MLGASIHWVPCVLATALVTGCTTARTVSLPPTAEEIRRLNASLRERDVDLALSGDVSSPNIARGRNVTLSLASVEWTDDRGQQRAPIDQLRDLRYLSAGQPRTRGFWEGAGIGLLVGAVGGAATGFAMGHDPPCTEIGCWSFSATQKAGLGAFFGGLIGAAIGGSIGAAIGHHDKIEFTAQPH